MNQTWVFSKIAQIPTSAQGEPSGDFLTVSQIDRAKALELKSSPIHWIKVTLPHNPEVETLNVNRPWQGICYYKKSFYAPLSWKRKLISLTLDGAMQISSVWLNGHYVGGRRGGYLPVVVKLASNIKFGAENQILVRLDNRDNPLIPPGKPTPDLDFLYYGGLYRDVFLTETNLVHITNPFLSNTPKGAGVVFNCESANKSLSTIETKTEIANETSVAKKVRIVQTLGSHRFVSTNYWIGPRSKKTIPLHYTIYHPKLWSPTAPNLYSLDTKVYSGTSLEDDKKIKVGIRRLVFSLQKGLLVNGVPTRLIGTNRHQEYPYIGNALSDNASFRDLKEIKEAGFNCIRLCHYPQDPAVMNACDQLGVFAIVCAPGWQYYNPNPIFENAVESDIKDMIRWHRNHPSVLAWEASLNETYPSKDIAEKWYKAAHFEFTESDMVSVGDAAHGFSWDWPYNSWKDSDLSRPLGNPQKPGYIREYGDWEFGGNSSTSRQPMTAGAKGELQEAWNFAWEHNKDRRQYPSTMGDGTWVMYDYHRGYFPETEHSGMASVFRYPRYIYYFFQSQYSLRPMVFIANQWTSQINSQKVVVFSNGDEVKLFVNGKIIKDQRPDSGPDTPYGNPNDGGNKWDGGNAKNLVHPPFTFKNIKFKPGTLKAVAYRKGKPVAREVIQTPSTVEGLSLKVNLMGIPLVADGADCVFVYVKLVDKNGTTVPLNGTPVSLKVIGPARVIGPSIMKSRDGIAPFLIQSTNKSGKITIEGKTGPFIQKITIASK